MARAEDVRAARVRRSAWREPMFPVGVALVLRVCVALLPISPSWDGVIYARAASQIASGQGYTQRALGLDQATPTAFYPVGFPTILAVGRSFGGGQAGDRAVQVLVGTAVVPLAYLWGRRAAGLRAGRIAAWLAAVWPGAVLLSGSWLAEPSFALAVGLALLPVTYARRRNRLRALGVTALALGFAAYIRPTALPIATCAGMLAGPWLATRHSRMRGALAAAGGAALCTALACIPLAPWVLRNHALLGAPVLVSTNGGFNLLMGARADGDYAALGVQDPCADVGLTEIARERCHERHALREIGRDPIRWLGRGLLKLTHTFGHESAPAQCLIEGLRLTPEAKASFAPWALALCRAGWLLLLIGAAPGIRSVARLRTSAPRVVLIAPVVAVAAVHFVYVGGDRYHAALIPVIAALAGAGYARSTPPPMRSPCS